MEGKGEYSKEQRREWREEREKLREATRRAERDKLEKGKDKKEDQGWERIATICQWSALKVSIMSMGK